VDITNTENHLEMKRVAAERKLHSIAKVNNWMEMWQSSQNLCATEKESWGQFQVTTAIESM